MEAKSSITIGSHDERRLTMSIKIVAPRSINRFEGVRRSQWAPSEELCLLEVNAVSAHCEREFAERTGRRAARAHVLRRTPLMRAREAVMRCSGRWHFISSATRIDRHLGLELRELAATT